MDICDNVMIGAMSLVNRSIVEPGVYVGVPVRRIKDSTGDEWVAHLPNRLWHWHVYRKRSGYSFALATSRCALR